MQNINCYICMYRRSCIGLKKHYSPAHAVSAYIIVFEKGFCNKLHLEVEMFTYTAVAVPHLNSTVCI